MRQGSGFGRLAATASLIAAGAALSGCMGSPTYGTDKTANEQLMTDMSNILSLGPTKREKIAYQPRPELVRPANSAAVAGDLPEPQQKVASASNPDWPESPEQRRARLRAEATANQDNPFYEPEIAMDGEGAPLRSTRAGTSWREEQRIVGAGRDSRRQRDDFKKKLAEQRQGSATARKYLSEPPLDYRQPAGTAPTDDIGEDEWDKEKRLKAEAKKKSGKGGGWFDWLPGA